MVWVLAEVSVVQDVDWRGDALAVLQSPVDPVIADPSPLRPVRTGGIKGVGKMRIRREPMCERREREKVCVQKRHPNMIRQGEE